jgi:spore maturation protein CgeB
MSGYRICFVSQLHYGSILAGFNREPAADETWAGLCAEVGGRRLVRTDAYSRASRALGNDAIEVLYDPLVLHRAWAREHGLPTKGHHYTAFIDAMTLGELAELRPDVVLVQGLGGYRPSFLSAIKDHVPSLRLLAGTEGATVKPATLRDLDLLFVGIPSLIEPARAVGLDPVLLYHGFDETQIQRLPADPGPPVDIVFSGTSGYGLTASHANRNKLLVELMRRTPMQAWVSEQDFQDSNPEAPDGARSLRRLFPDRCHPAVWGEEMLRLLQRARIVVNPHGMVPGSCSGNMRLFEATGIGACMMTDAAWNLADMFEADREVVVFRSADEAVEKINWLLTHEDERRAIAAAGQARTLTDHTISARSLEIDKAIRALL